MPQYAAVGFVYKDGSFILSERRKLGDVLGYKNPYGIRDVREAQKELNRLPDVVTIVFASRDTEGWAESVGESPTPEQVDKIEDEYGLRNEHDTDRSPGARSGPVVGDRVPVSQKHEGHSPGGMRENTVVRQRENELVLRYQEWLGREIVKHTVQHEGSVRQLEIDAFDEKTKTLIEAKSLAHRRSVQTAIGQLFDYGREFDHGYKLILLPEKPERDLLSLAHSLDIHICYEQGDDFVYCCDG